MKRYTNYTDQLTIWLFAILLPVTDKYNICFTGLTTYTLIFSILVAHTLRILFKHETYTWNKIDLLWGLVISWSIIRLLTSSYPVDSITIFYFVCLFMLYYWTRNAHYNNTFVLALSISGIIQAIWGILQFIDILPSYHVYFKQTGSFINPSLWGIYLTLSIISCSLLLYHTSKNIYKICLIGGLCIMLTGISLAHSRAAWFALINGMVWIYCKSNKYHYQQFNKRMIYSCTLITFLTLLLLGGMYLIHPASANGRILIYLVSFSIFGQAPWFGHGISSFKAMYMPQQALWFQQNSNSIFIPIAENNYTAFNEYIKIACETGIIGLTLFSVLLFYCLKISPKEHNNIRHYQVLLISFSIFSVFGYPFENISITLIFCTIIAIIAKETTLKRHTIYISRFTKKILTIILLIISFLFYNQIILRTKAEQTLKTVTTEKTWMKYYPQLINSPEFVLWLAEELYTCKKYSEALPVLEQAYKLRPNSMVLNNIGLCYQYSQKFDKAQNAFQQAHLMVPAHILPQFYLFSLYQETGEKDKAEKIAKKALATKAKITNTTVLKARYIMKSFLKNSYNKTKERRCYEIDRNKQNFKEELCDD